MQQVYIGMYVEEQYTAVCLYTIPWLQVQIVHFKACCYSESPQKISAAIKIFCEAVCSTCAHDYLLCFSPLSTVCDGMEAQRQPPSTNEFPSHSEDW